MLNTRKPGVNIVTCACFAEMQVYAREASAGKINGMYQDWIADMDDMQLVQLLVVRGDFA